MAQDGIIIDLYIHLTLGRMIYIDGSKLMEHKEYTSFNGIEIPVLKTYAETLLAIAHAIYKERIYTLNDYVTVRSWFSKRSIRLAEELNCLDAIREVNVIHHLVEENSLILPYRIPFTRWLRLLEHKILYDKLTRTTILNLTKALKDHRFGNLVLSKLIKETY